MMVEPSRANQGPKSSMKKKVLLPRILFVFVGMVLIESAAINKGKRGEKLWYIFVFGLGRDKAGMCSKQTAALHAKEKRICELEEEITNIRNGPDGMGEITV
jgi:hypothetical protein